MEELHFLRAEVAKLVAGGGFVARGASCAPTRERLARQACAGLRAAAAPVREQPVAPNSRQAKPLQLPAMHAGTSERAREPSAFARTGAEGQSRPADASAGAD